MLNDTHLEKIHHYLYSCSTVHFACKEFTGNSITDSSWGPDRRYQSLYTYISKL